MMLRMHDWDGGAITASEAELWGAAGFDPLDAAAWRDAGITDPAEAVQWQLVDCDACAAGELRALGYDPGSTPAIDGLAGLLTAA